MVIGVRFVAGPLREAVISTDDRVTYRHKVHRCLDVLAQMLDQGAFDTTDGMTGLEIELNLIDDTARPAMRNAEVLAQLSDPLFQTELGRFNIELNARPRSIADRGLADYENDLLESLGRAATKSDSGLALIGMLPTLSPDHLVLEPTCQRQRAVPPAQRRDGRRPWRAVPPGHPRRRTVAERRATRSCPRRPAPASSSTCRCRPDRFARYWNASQAVAGIQVAIGANSPFLHGRRLWAETRIALFEQATDTRPDELKAQGVRPRVWFGERWITSVFDLFEENVKLLPARCCRSLSDEDPAEVLRAGRRTPGWANCVCTTARCTAGTGRCTT